MASINRSVQLSVAPERAWEIVTDSDRYADWQIWHGGFPDSAPSSFTPDVSFKEVMKMMGQEAEIEWKIEEVDAPNRLVFSGQAPMGIQVRTTYTIEAANGGARLTLEREFKGAAVVAVKTMLEQQVGQNIEDSLESLKGLRS